MPQVPFFALHDWRAAFERLGVTIDRDAYEQINLIEQDAAKQASDAGAGQREDRHDGAALSIDRSRKKENAFTFFLDLAIERKSVLSIEREKRIM